MSRVLSWPQRESAKHTRTHTHTHIQFFTESVSTVRWYVLMPRVLFKNKFLFLFIFVLFFFCCFLLLWQLSASLIAFSAPIVQRRSELLLFVVWALSTMPYICSYTYSYTYFTCVASSLVLLFSLYLLLLLLFGLFVISLIWFAALRGPWHCFSRLSAHFALWRTGERRITPSLILPKKRNLLKS